MPCFRNSSAGPTPESCSNCGELYAPPETRISFRARAIREAPDLLYSTADARRRSNRMRWTKAEVSICRLLRPLAGRRYDTAVLALLPYRVVVWKNPAPSWVAPLKSEFFGMPVSAAAAMKAAESGSAWLRLETGSG